MSEDRHAKNVKAARERDARLRGSLDFLIIPEVDCRNLLAYIDELEGGIKTGCVYCGHTETGGKG